MNVSTNNHHALDAMPDLSPFESLFLDQSICIARDDRDKSPPIYDTPSGNDDGDGALLRAA
jgi:hypothetical protein